MKLQLTALVVEKVVLVPTEPEGEALLGPQLCQEFLTLLLVVFEGVAFAEIVVEACETLLTVSVDSGVIWLELILLFLGQITSAHGKCKVGCALVDCEMFGGRTHLLNHLYS